MTDRVLNFSEFSDKYSSDEELDVNDMADASSNFEEGFDDASYDSPEIKPNKRVEDGESSIPSPGEEGAPSFNSNVDSEMTAPKEETGDEIENVEADTESTEDESEVEGSPIPPVDFDEDGGNPEDDDEDDDEDEDEDDDDEEEEANESLNVGLLESFDSFIKSYN